MFRRKSWRSAKRSSSSRVAVKTVRRVLNKRERLNAEWKPILTNHCQFLSYVPDPNGPFCPEPGGGIGNIVLWDPLRQGTAGGNFTTNAVDLHPGDKVIHRLTGDVYFTSRWVNQTPDQAQASTASQNTILRVGLMKQRGDIDANFSESLLTANPLHAHFSEDLTVPGSEGDWTERRWLRMWEHHFFSSNSIEQNFFPPTCCPVITGGGGGSSAIVNGTTWGITSGAINTSVDPISTDCQPCGVAEGNTWQVGPFGAGPFVTVRASIPGWWKLHIDVRTRLRMENTDRLDLWLGWYDAHAVGTNPHAQPNILFKGTVKALVENH